MRCVPADFQCRKQSFSNWKPNYILAKAFSFRLFLDSAYRYPEHDSKHDRDCCTAFHRLPTMPALWVLILTVLVWFTAKFLVIGKRQRGLPPGPPTVPILGNLHVFPTEFAHFKFTEWAKIYGEIYSLKIGPGTAVVLSSMAAVKELMERRSGSTADRPFNHMADAVAGGLNMVLAPYGEDWRVLRKAAHTILTPQASDRHLPIQKAEAYQLLYDLLVQPEGFYTHVRRYSNAVIMSVLYGKRSPRYETKEATAFFEAQHLWELALEPGAHPPVDLLPFLNYIPERWAPWKQLCKETRKRQQALYFGLLEECEARMARGVENGCFMEEVIQRQVEFGLRRDLVGYLGGVLIEGGSDTTSSFLQSLILALFAFPAVQEKAREEIDRVIGDHRMPELKDFSNLPYVRAILQETHRFRPVAPLAIPHATLQDEEYKGHLIPKGSAIFVNAWGIFHDPDVFEDPAVFNPDRFMKSEHGVKPGVDDRDYRSNFAFGSGRRICPGIHLANNSLVGTIYAGFENASSFPARRCSTR
ncbi:hypothetical protein HGRIS_003756 [Hohenbuehelia grisea]|uniref:Cytochrome P450 n=1 Tax=Hohenbuehelia grisea TaxID=104357 RepID=A0ABR3JH66_9AGAR